MHIENEPEVYFKVKYFYIYNKDTNEKIIINDEKINEICSKKHDLQQKTDEHYDPPILINFLKFYSTLYPTEKFIVLYKYEYFNHGHINTYMNRMSVHNSTIVDKIGLID